MSEVNKDVREEECDQEKIDSDDKLRSIPRSFTNPDKFGGGCKEETSAIGGVNG